MGNRVVVLKADGPRRSATFVFGDATCEATYRDHENRPIRKRTVRPVDAELHIVWLQKQGMAVDIDEPDVDFD